ncbi:hypothetical protein LEP1GSC072_1242 [Leptospira noguchii str. Bonito]|nr:hypothetical protein LEP1GSC072_1242 [Leptospira noguchii str. Bonito]
MFSIHYTSLYYFGEVSFKNLILSDTCGVGYGSLWIAFKLSTTISMNRVGNSASRFYGRSK